MRRAIIILGLLALLGGGAFAYINWSNRYRWPREVSQDYFPPPPPDRSAWPKPPVPWKIETNLVEVATPAGIEYRPVVYHVNPRGMKFVRVPPGHFWMGLTASQAQRLNAGKKRGCPVTLTRAYYLAAHEVSLELYEQFDPAFRRQKFQRGAAFAQHPALGVTWRDAQRFCQWLGAQDGRTYRLPTEAEWEYAAKAGTTTILYWGDNPWDRWKANTGGLRSVPESYSEDGWPTTAPVGTYPANPWGLFDMVGNAWEWVADWFDWYPDKPQTDPVGPDTGKIRVKKGAGWDTRTRDLKTCARDGNNPADLFEKNGFRVLCETD